MDEAAAILDTALDFLGEDPGGDEPYAWCEDGEPALATLLDLVFAMDGDPGPLIDELIGLGSALNLELRSPKAAAVLFTVLRSDERVMALLEPEASEAVQERRVRLIGAEEIRSAPMFRFTKKTRIVARPSANRRQYRVG